MSNVKVRIKVGDAEIDAEGAKADVHDILDKWWSIVSSGNSAEPSAGGPKEKEAERAVRRPAKARVVKKTGAVPSPGGGEEKFDANALANTIKQHEKFRAFRDKVLHGTNRFNKVALICYLSDAPLTSGDIDRTLSALGVKVGVGNVSSVIGKRSGDFMNSSPRKAGGAVPRYKLTSHAETEFEAVLNEQA